MAIKANYTSVFRLFTLHFLFLILSLSSFAQQNYPVQANLVIIPPNSPYLSDYVSQSGKMLVNLFMKDLTKSQYPSRLHVKIEGSGITIESKNDFYVEPFYMNGGEMTMLTGDDLAPYLNPQNLVYQGVDLKRSGGKLPDGLYQITVQVKDYYRKSVVSNAGFSLLSVFLSYPPIINLPFNQAKVRAMEPQNVMFQWTPRHTGSINAAYNVAYKFTLTEVFAGRDPNDAMRSTRPFYETFTDLTMLVYGPGEPALTPGNQYAVKVQAVEADGRDIFINNGNSEVSSFTYGDKCSVPTNMLAQVSGRSTLKVSWNETPLQQAFTVRYRQADNATAEWFEKEVFTAQAELQGLRQGYTYEYQIKAQCGYGYGDYSASERFSMPDENVTSGTLVCGKAPDGKTLDKSKLLPVLSPPMIFMAGDFPVVVTKAAGQNGTFTGTGTVGIPFLNSLSFKVSFTNITINTDLQLVAGVVIVAQQSLLESKKQLVASITVTPDANGKVTVASQNGLPVIIEASFDTSQTPVFNPESKILTVYTTSKDMPKLEVTISGDLPQTIQDKDENTYEIAKDGTVKALGKVPVSELLAGSNISAKELSTNRAKVVFQKSGNQSYGFDVKKDTEFGNAAFEGNYQQVSGKFISWKSVETGKSDEVLARFENLDQVNPIDPEKIEFHNGSDEKLSSSLNTSDNTFTIQIIGSPEGNDKEIYAFYPDGKLNLTKLNIASYQKIEKKVVIVPVNGAGNNLGAGTVQNYLNTVYQQAVVGWQLTKADNFQVDKALYDSKDDGLDVDNSNAMSAYTAEQKTLASLYKKDHPFENNTYYIFLIDRFSDANQTGYMVRSGQVGFVSVSDETTTMHSIAHELGHGAFNLKHSWEEYGTSQGTTQNLMDYSGGTDLIKAQWAYIRNPDWVFRAFEGDENGAEKIVKDSEFGNEFLKKIKKLIIAKKTFDEMQDYRSIYFTSNNILIGDESIETINVSYGRLSQQGSSIDLQKYEKVVPEAGKIGVKIGDKLFITCNTEQDRQKLINYLWSSGSSDSKREGLIIFANGFKLGKELADELSKKSSVFIDKVELIKQKIEEAANNGDINRNSDVAVKDDSEYWGNIGEAFASKIGYNEKLFVDGSFDFGTARSARGFANRVAGGRVAGAKIIEMLTAGKKIKLSSKTIPIDIVSHSMGYAYALGVIEVLQKAGYKIGWFYALAPENPTEGYVPKNIDGIWQYGTNEEDGDWWYNHDFIAPQSPIPGIGTRRIFIPDFAPHGLVDSHSISNYGWIFGIIQSGQNNKGYVKER